MDDDAVKIFQELNTLYRTFFDIQRGLFRPSFRKKRFDYEKLANQARETHERVQTLNTELSKSNFSNKLFLNYAHNLDLTTSWMYLYLMGKSIDSGGEDSANTNVAFDELFKASRALTKSAKKVS